MKIEVNQSNAEPWGRLSVEETRLASKRLSGEAFKIWVSLALNQDGFMWCGDLEASTRRELSDYGYLFQLDDGNYLFRPDGEVEDADIPAAWEKIIELYGPNSRQDWIHVRNKLQAAYLGDRTEEILSYWLKKYKELQEIDHSKARNRLKYDLSIVIVWWLWDNFRFQPGDVLEVGQGAKLLRFHDSMFAVTIQDGALKRGITKIRMNEKASDFWNSKLSSKKVEIPIESVAKILKNRCSAESSI